MQAKRRTAILMLAALACTLDAWGQVDTQTLTSGQARAVQVRDIIEFTWIVEPDGARTTVSPGDSWFYVLTKHGNLERRTTDYTLRCYNARRVRTAIRKADSEPDPDASARVSSSSNEPGISLVRWVDDTTVAFLGNQADDSEQVYTLNCSTGTLSKLTESLNGVDAFDISRGVVLTVDHELLPSKWQARTDDFVVRDEAFRQLAWPAAEVPGRDARYTARMWVQGTAPRAVASWRSSNNATARVWLSPDASRAVVLRPFDRVESGWERLTYSEFHKFRVGQKVSGWHGQYFLLDLRTETMAPVLSAPAKAHWEAIWLDDTSIVLTGTYLPVDKFSDKIEPVVAEVNTRTNDIAIITGSLDFVRSDSAKMLVDAKYQDGVLSLQCQHWRDERRTALRFVREGAGRWRALGQAMGNPKGLEIKNEESYDKPPRIVAVDRASGGTLTLPDLNPRLTELTVNPISVVRWHDRRGRLWTGGLVVPAGLVSGRRVPLVIQTHGFPRDRFLIDGAHPTAFAAQALAARGIAVVQMEDQFESPSRDEAPSFVDAYEALVSTLDSAGLIDPSKVGLSGFSRTSFHIKYAITHSKVPFAVAATADAFDMSYTNYVMAFNTDDGSVRRDIERNNGGSPYGAGVHSWLESSPALNAHRVTAPLLVQAIRPNALAHEWDMYAALRIVGSPVEMLYFPDGTHSLVKPHERSASLSAVTDWFDFWLNGHQEPDPAKVEQYDRWRKLRGPVR